MRKSPKLNRQCGARTILHLSSLASSEATTTPRSRLRGSISLAATSADLPIMTLRAIPCTAWPASGFQFEFSFFELLLTPLLSYIPQYCSYPCNDKAPGKASSSLLMAKAGTGSISWKGKLKYLLMALSSLKDGAICHTTIFLVPFLGLRFCFFGHEG
jgi:hypothetical protein